MTTLRPFLSYYGGKWRAARRYPEPAHDVIIEPFAGSAGYATRYADRRVILVEKNPKIAAVWRYLVAADPNKIVALPDIGDEGVEAHDISQPERWLIGMWLNAATTSPRSTLSAWGRAAVARRPTAAEWWGPGRREIIASQVGAIRHWTVIEGDYSDAPDIEATWFIDPPYANAAGRHYPTTIALDEYDRLACWCVSRRGQSIVCENEGASWMPFRPLGSIKSTRGVSKEVIWTGSASSVQMSLGV